MSSPEEDTPTRCHTPGCYLAAGHKERCALPVRRELRPEVPQHSKSVGLKFDEDKPRYELIAYGLIEQMALVLGEGAKKYGERNWEKGLKASRLYGAAMRHLTAFWGGEDLDPETKRPHLAHAACCLMMLYEMSKLPEWMDRP